MVIPVRNEDEVEESHKLIELFTKIHGRLLVWYAVVKIGGPNGVDSRPSNTWNRSNITNSVAPPIIEHLLALPTDDWVDDDPSGKRALPAIIIDRAFPVWKKWVQIRPIAWTWKMTSSLAGRHFLRDALTGHLRAECRGRKNQVHQGAMGMKRRVWKFIHPSKLLITLAKVRELLASIQLPSTAVDYLLIPCGLSIQLLWSVLSHLNPWANHTVFE